MVCATDPDQGKSNEYLRTANLDQLCEFISNGFRFLIKSFALISANYDCHEHEIKSIVFSFSRWPVFSFTISIFVDLKSKCSDDHEIKFNCVINSFSERPTNGYP